MPNTDNGRASLASLEATVNGLSSSIAELARRFEVVTGDLYSKLSGRNVQPGTWLGVVSIVITVSMGVLGAGAVWTSQRMAPIEDSIRRIDYERKDEKRDRNEADKALHTALKEAELLNREERKLLRDESRAERNTIVEQFREIRGSIVSRGEHEQRWAAQTAALLAVDRRLDETRKQLADISSPQDAFKELQRQITELRTLIYRERSATPLAPQ